jgi:superfamily II DNA or RNA helicase
MKLIIDNQLSLLNIPAEIKEWFVEQLTFTNPKFEDAVKFGRYIGNIPQYLKMYKSLPAGIVVPRGYLQMVEDSMIGQGLGLSIKDNRVLTPPISTESLIELRPYQAEAKFNLLGHPNGMLVAPAASGKTIMGLDVFASVRQKMLWLTHTNRLAAQVIDRIVGTDEYSPTFFNIKRDDIGFIGGGKERIGKEITIGMIQTLVRREHVLPKIGREFGLVIIDEAHHVPASTFLRVTGYFSSYYLYGLTATPYRRDKLENVMFAAVGFPNAEIHRKEIKSKGAIITPTVVKRMVPSSNMFKEVNDYAFLLRDVLPANSVRTEMIVSDVVREARNNNYCITIGSRKAYCNLLFMRLNHELPGKVAIATGDYSEKHNEEQVQKIDRGEINVLITTFELLGEGFDVPRLNRGFIVLPFRERARVEQAVGRIQRPCEGKKDALLYDYVDENIGILKNQFVQRAFVYRLLGMHIVS